MHRLALGSLLDVVLIAECMKGFSVRLYLCISAPILLRGLRNSPDCVETMGGRQQRYFVHASWVLGPLL